MNIKKIKEMKERVGWKTLDAEFLDFLVNYLESGKDADEAISLATRDTLSTIVFYYEFSDWLEDHTSDDVVSTTIEELGIKQGTVWDVIRALMELYYTELGRKVLEVK